MTKSEKFKQVFGIYAEEFWAKPEREMLEWIAEEAEERTAKVTNIEFVQTNGYAVGTYLGDCECGHKAISWNKYCPSCGAKLEWE